MYQSDSQRQIHMKFIVICYIYKSIFRVCVCVCLNEGREKEENQNHLIKNLYTFIRVVYIHKGELFVSFSNIFLEINRKKYDFLSDVLFVLTCHLYVCERLSRKEIRSCHHLL